ncbi:cytidine deaminase family protein [Coccidioides posadasii C735 delta SOWgp]|uniref:Cytidine deaminase n=1 Tax=Coccidioides posadasii (strain C735) TaxID=222929 RepID=C5P310_COCP7|nr:cytidine deaminase family protein [Coccidioides posadasii C735 delta SOWgp]EER28698.1 cytidine deaminase family protein [Coccidioides posadasii C735 delta SOWgp]|eukprot:XP_003070843.1 cytidine deaminase family protein [Coccidioides posadasii C735 delta SOWgp]
MAATALTEAELATLSAKAIGAKDVAYCPYSKFRVGASLLAEDGTFFVGANVENASYPVGICAEKCVFGTAVVSPFQRDTFPRFPRSTAGHRSFKAVAVASDIIPGTSPCGSCRQFMRQFCPPSFPVYMYGNDGKYVMKTMGELLPDSFGPEDLER